jgi:hypothetical protein
MFIYFNYNVSVSIALIIQVSYLQKNVDTEFSELLDAAERTIGLYFSYDSNLTVT